jgi:type IV pilus assembly protein PilB
MADVEMGETQPLVVEILRAQGRIKQDEIKVIRQTQKQKGVSLEEALVEHGKASASELATLYADHFRLSLVDLSKQPDQLLALKEFLPEKVLRTNQMVVVRRDETSCEIAVADPTRLSIVGEIQLLTGLDVQLSVAPINQINAAIEHLFGARDVMKEMVADVGANATAAEDQAEGILSLDKEVEAGAEAKIIRLVNQLLKSAIEEKASDIHLEPTPDDLRVRFRTDGMLREVAPVPKVNAVPMISRLKILAKMDIAEKRLPQDGAIQIIFRDKRIDFRVNTVPAIWGEKMVIRILNRDAQVLEHKALGFNDRQCDDFKVAAHSSHGLIFVTGPTGSGKSTTLYATLELLKSPKINLSTVEDPVEYKMVGVNQIQVKASIGLTFASVLRAFLRQDPDVILVGEVRDQETAQICLRAALTGHLVLSTLHTNSALVTVSRLTDLGMEPFMISSSLRLLEAQRLVRKLCVQCKEPYTPTKEIIDRHKLPSHTVLYRHRGCEACGGLGYKRRVGVFEVVRITPELSELIRISAPTAKMEEVALSNGTLFMAQHGVERAMRGETSLEEVYRVTQAGDE